MKFERLIVLTVSAACTLAAANLTTGMQSGKADLKSAGPLAFGPDGVLFIGDPLGAQIFAVDTGDAKAGKASEADLPGLNDKIAAHLGSSADQILVNDLAVNPISKVVYLSVQRGRGPEAMPVVLRIRNGKIEDLKLDSIRHSSASIPNAPADAKDQRGNNRRSEAITGLGFIDGKLYVAALSSEEFASTFRCCRSRSPGRGQGHDGRDLPRVAREAGDERRRSGRSPSYQIAGDATPAGRLHLHAARQDPRRGAEAGGEDEGHDRGRVGQPQHAARHGRVQQGRQADYLLMINPTTAG